MLRKNDKDAVRLMAPKNCVLGALFICVAVLSIHPHEVNSSVKRTVKVRVAVDEEFRRRPPQFLEARKWVRAASDFFEKNFGLAIQVEDLKYWSSDNSKRTLSALFQNLYDDIERGESDIVLGFTGQIRSESWVSGVASYPHGYALVKRMKHEYLTRVTVIHELCHLFGAVDLEKESSIMNKGDPRLKCDEFTKRIICLNRGRHFGVAVFPLSAEDMNAILPLYIERKGLQRGEAGVSLMLAIFYLEMKDFDKATQECLDAEQIAPRDPAIQRLLRLAQQRK